MSAYQETKIHGTPGFPYIVYPGILPEHISGIPHHWHEEMEIIYVTDGMISVSVGNNEYALSVGGYLPGEISGADLQSQAVDAGISDAGASSAQSDRAHHPQAHDRTALSTVP